MMDSGWLQKKWGVQKTPSDELFDRLTILEEQVKQLQDENIELTNELYRLENSLEARIDILASEPYDLHRFALDK